MSLYSGVKKGKADINGISVQVKLTIPGEANAIDELAPKISLYANSQNKVNTADFSASHPFHIHILLAEMMLRRTNAPQVIPTYMDMIRRYPDPESLATAPIQQVLGTLRPLGLAWRAENIRQMAEMLTKHFGGNVPSTYKELIKLPGVGDYVASAVCCFAFGKPLPVIDTNTVRVAGRYFGFTTHAESRRRCPARETIVAITSRRNTRDFSYAFLDIAALVCKATKPACPSCPLRHRCVFGQERLGISRHKRKH